MKVSVEFSQVNELQSTEVESCTHGMTIELMVLLLLNVVTMTEIQQTPHSPERGESKTGIFNFDRLSPEEIAWMGEGMAFVGNQVELDPDKSHPYVDTLFANDFEALVEQDPEKAEDVVQLLQEQNSNESLTMAAKVVRYFAETNYELTSDTLISILEKEDMSLGDAHELAMLVCMDLVRQLPEDQAADLKVRFEEATD